MTEYVVMWLSGIMVGVTSIIRRGVNSYEIGKIYNNGAWDFVVMGVLPEYDC